MLLLGKKISASEAAAIGLISDVTGTGSALKRAKEVASILAAKAPSAVRMTKQLLKDSPESAEDRMNRENALFAPRLQSEEFKESVTAFFEKRDPDYSNCS